MTFLFWVVLGLVAGLIGSRLVNKKREGIMFDVLLGIVGAVSGGTLFNALGVHAGSNLNFYSLFVAVAGSVLFLAIYHAMFRRA